MNALVLGGTGMIGRHLVRDLLDKGIAVTIATRGRAGDPFGDRIERLVADRADARSLAGALRGRTFDAIIDNQAYSSNEVGDLLAYAHAPRYILTSTASVYHPDLHEGLQEQEMDTLTYPLRWIARADGAYDELKRQAECALFQAFPEQDAVAMRIPLVMGTDDDTGRLAFYVEHIAKGLPMYVNNPDARLGFIASEEAGRFLSWLVEADVTGPVHAASEGTMSVREIIECAERATGRKAILAEGAEEAALNGHVSYSLDTRIAREAGFRFSHVADWLPGVIEAYAERLRGSERKRG